jgi:chemotaxis-related protein WspD
MAEHVKQESAQIIHCWTTIGVWGRQRPRCPLLATVVHCRNCDKFISAGRRALQRPTPADYVKEWTSALAREKETPAGHHLTVLVFRIGDEWFSLPINYLQQVETGRIVHSLPHRQSAYVKGVVNVAGEARLCFSLGALLGIERPSLTDPTQRTAVAEGLLLLRKDKRAYVFPVTEVRALTQLNLANVTSAPSTLSGSASSFLLGLFELDGIHVGYLDPDLVIAGFERVVR